MRSIFIDKLRGNLTSCCDRELLELLGKLGNYQGYRWKNYFFSFVLKIKSLEKNSNFNVEN